MGASKRDMAKKEREYSARYSYEPVGVAALLKDISRLNESRIFKGDIDATVIITDLKLALDSDCLTPRMRQVVALYYFVGMTEEEISRTIFNTQQVVNKSIKKAVERIASEMAYGAYVKSGHADFEFTEQTPLYKWLTEVGYGNLPVYEVPDEVFTNLLKISTADDRAREVLRQRKYGPPETTKLEEEDEYPALTEDQFKWRDRRMTFKDEIFPAGDSTGSRKVAIKLRDGDSAGNEWVLEKRKIFARGGN